MRKTEREDLLSVGLYTPAQAARLTGMSPARVRRWVRGHEFQYATRAGTRRGVSPPVVSGNIPRIGRCGAVSFLQLIEILLVRAMLDRGVSLRVVRRAHRRAAAILDTPHPFAFERFKTDGTGSFLTLRDEAEDYERLLELSSGQYALPKILNEYLEQVEFSGRTSLARRWWPLGQGRPVVLDPAIAFGHPVIEGTRIPVQVVLNALKAGESPRAVCEWFDLPRAAISAANALARRGMAA